MTGRRSRAVDCRPLRHPGRLRRRRGDTRDGALSARAPCHTRVRSEAVMAAAMSVETKPFLLDLLTRSLESAQATDRSRVAAALALSLAVRREAKRHGRASSVARSAAAALLEAARDDAIPVRAECARGLCDIEDRISFRDPVLSREILHFLATRLSEPDADTSPGIRPCPGAHPGPREGTSGCAPGGRGGAPVHRRGRCVAGRLPSSREGERFQPRHDRGPAVLPGPGRRDRNRARRQHSTEAVPSTGPKGCS